MLPDEAVVTTEISTRYATQLKAMNDLHNAVVGMMTVDQWTMPPSAIVKKPFTIDILRGLLTKACKTYRSIQLLCERGLHEDANALVRVLLETTVAVLWILQRRRKDKKTVALTPTAHQRAITFHAYSMYQQLKMLKEWQKTPGLKRKAPKRIVEQATKQIAELRVMLPAGTDFESYWSGKGNLPNTMKALKQDVLYATLYRTTSATSHGSDLGAHFEYDPSTGHLIWQLPPRVNYVMGPSFIARELLWMLANRIDERLGLGFAGVLAPHKLKKSELSA
jgi:hypothetical protein